VRTAVLVIGHRDVGQLNALVSHLASDFDVYVHLDRRSSLRIDEVITHERVHVIRRRRVHWGSYGMILATRDLMALAASAHFDRYLLISGQDIPLKTNADITTFFAEHEEDEFIECEPMPRPGEGENGWMDRVTRYYLPSAEGVPGFRGLLHRKAFWAVYGWNSRLHISRGTAGFVFYGGANWWSLTHAAVQSVLDLVDREPTFLRRFRMTSCCDEIFVQTALIKTGFRDRMVSSSLRFTEWDPGSAHPRVLRVDDYERIRGSSSLFARKIDRTVDPDIERMLWCDVAQATGCRDPLPSLTLERPAPGPTP